MKSVLFLWVQPALPQVQISLHGLLSDAFGLGQYPGLARDCFLRASPPFSCSLVTLRHLSSSTFNFNTSPCWVTPMFYFPGIIYWNGQLFVFLSNSVWTLSMMTFMMRPQGHGPYELDDCLPTRPQLMHLLFLPCVDILERWQRPKKGPITYCCLYLDFQYYETMGNKF